MTTTIDSNVISALLRNEQGAVSLSHKLAAARQTGPLVIHASVYAELSAAPVQTVPSVSTFLNHTSISVDWDTQQHVWKTASDAFRAYSIRRQGSGGGLPRRLLIDFLIGAHAQHLSAALMTLDPQHYRLSFPTLPLL